jgi:hypothetical protein
MTSQPRRRWFRFAFGLRTLFVAVTLAAITTGWLLMNLQIVWQRKALLRECERASSSTAFFTYSQTFWGDADADYASVSIVRQLLGDQGYVSICIPTGLDPFFLLKLEKAFPEAQLETVRSPGFDADDPYFAARSFRDSLSKPVAMRRPNQGHEFKTGLIEKPSQAPSTP